MLFFLGLFVVVALGVAVGGAYRQEIIVLLRVTVHVVFTLIGWALMLGLLALLGYGFFSGKLRALVTRAVDATWPWSGVVFFSLLGWILWVQFIDNRERKKVLRAQADGTEPDIKRSTSESSHGST